MCVMEWGNYEHHIAIVALHCAGKSAADIFSLLKSIGINRLFVHRAIELYQENSDAVNML